MQANIQVTGALWLSGKHSLAGSCNWGIVKDKEFLWQKDKKGTQRAGRWQLCIRLAPDLLHDFGKWLWRAGSFTTDFNERRIWFSYSKLLIFSSVKQNNYPYLIPWCATKSTMNFSKRSCYKTHHLGKLSELALSTAAPELTAQQPHQLRLAVH